MVQVKRSFRSWLIGSTEPVAFHGATAVYETDTEPEVTKEMKAAGADVLVAFRDSYDDWSLVEAVYKAMRLLRWSEMGWPEPRWITDAQKTGEWWLVWFDAERNGQWVKARWISGGWRVDGGSGYPLAPHLVTHYLPLPPDFHVR